MKTIRMVIADDHAVVRVGLRAILEEMPEVQVVAEATDGEEALALARAHQPDVLLADITMPGLDGLDLTEQIAREAVPTRVLILSVHKEKAYATRAMAAGAAGYMLKEAGAQELHAAVRAVARGESYLSPPVSSHIVADYARLVRTEAGANAELLTPRQREVLKLIAQGLPNKSIARALGISLKTAEAHRSDLMKRLNIHDVPGLVRFAMRIGLIEQD